MSTQAAEHLQVEVFSLTLSCPFLASLSAVSDFKQLLWTHTK